MDSNLIYLIHAIFHLQYQRIETIFHRTDFIIRYNRYTPQMHYYIAPKWYLEIHKNSLLSTTYPHSPVPFVHYYTHVHHYDLPLITIYLYENRNRNIFRKKFRLHHDNYNGLVSMYMQYTILNFKWQTMALVVQ